ncbi:asparagine synthase (glutamine-hydrolyzing) [Bradyrhizobium genosp. L]|uniref:asparagine synthase (glutamine-hydrolyzing) n=1 Tax=Bradyrhizobium genosp. L TaxID=83637 RepID=UPI0018A3265D|nr:asparagine synthase (glutamine-hydrolyzing) [Bradyrhizobium genosp. L]QPF86897.1 asparagine synthase (glutamine-hydrolyzing) [Bradyrhizobium genosp. L]
MCGIAGILHLDGRNVDRALLERMNATLVHRGPDAGETWCDGAIGFAHRRLAIRDLTDAGRQPMSDPSGRITVTYNGEIYNEAELRRELERDFGVVFRSHCDTEVLPAGYLAWGDELFSRIEGIFAIGLWDNAERRLVLARDSIGTKPLFFSRVESTVRFASEIKGILADPAHPREFDADGLHRFLAMGYVGPTATTMRHIRQVEPGALTIFQHGSESARRFWRPRRTARFRRLDEAVETFLPLFERVVGDQLVSDVPVGVLQSGGIDSSLIAYSLAKRGQFPLVTASFAEQSHDESKIASLVAQQTALPHRIVPISEDPDPAATLARVVHHFDGQVADESAGPLLLLTAELRRNSTVALSGDGADEFFGGYPTYRATRMAERFGGAIPTGIARSVGRLMYRASGADETRLPATALLSRFLLGLAAGGPLAHAEWRRYIPEFLVRRIYGPALRHLEGVSPMAGYRTAIEQADGPALLDRCLIADQTYHLPAGLLMKTDAMSMANGVEIRVPFLDRRIMELSGACSAELIVQPGGPTKPLLRQALRDKGAAAAIWQAPKRGFNNPLSGLLRGALRPLAERTFERSTDIFAPYLQPDAVRALWREHADLKTNHAYALWPLLSFALWRSELEGRSLA